MPKYLIMHVQHVTANSAENHINLDTWTQEGYNSFLDASKGNGIQADHLILVTHAKKTSSQCNNNILDNYDIIAIYTELRTRTNDTCHYGISY